MFHIIIIFSYLKIIFGVKSSFYAKICESFKFMFDIYADSPGAILINGIPGRKKH